MTIQKKKNDPQQENDILHHYEIFLFQEENTKQHNGYIGLHIQYQEEKDTNQEDDLLYHHQQWNDFVFSLFQEKDPNQNCYHYFWTLNHNSNLIFEIDLEIELIINLEEKLRFSP